MNHLRNRPHRSLAFAFVLAVISVTAPACGGGGSSDATATPGATTTATDGLGLPEIPALNCRALLTQEAIEDALDAWNRPAGDMDTLGTSRGEVCGERIASDEAVFVRIEPGEPEDFEPGTRLLGVEGAPVGDVGDAALWFGGTGAQGGGEQGLLSVAQRSAFGGVVFRIALGRPDLSPDEQMEVAKATALVAIRRFPGIEPPEPVVINIEPGPVDQSGQGFVENLLAREADGEWTRGAGLVATLEYLAGERPASGVLRHGEVLDASATGVLRLALEYVETGTDAAAVEEVERLLTLLTVREPLRTDVQAEGTPVWASIPAAPGPLLASRAAQGQDPPPDDGRCYTVYPNHGDPCFTSTAAAPEFGNRYVFWYPALEGGQTEWEGWTRGPSTIRDAIRKTAQQLEGIGGGMPPRTEVWLAPFDGHSSVLLREDRCVIHLNKGAQALRDQDPELLQQAVAHVIARCYVEWNYRLPEQWEAPIAWYLSDVVYPNASMETLIMKIPGTLATEELGRPLTGRSLANMPFFEYLDAARGLEGTMEAVGVIAESGLGAVPGIENVLHEYGQALTDGVIFDQAGIHRYDAPRNSQVLVEGTAISPIVAPFGIARIRVSTGSGQYACLEYPDIANLDIRVSWRDGVPGESGDWSDQLPDSVSGDAVFVLTAADAVGLFRILVTEVDDDRECEDDDGGAPPAPSACPMFCDPSDYFHSWETIQQYINEYLDD